VATAAQSLDAAEELLGGETTLQLNPRFSHTSAFTTRPNSALLFRKDVPHEGLLVQAGRKRILTLNLLAKRRASERVLIVTFPNETVASPASQSALPGFVPRDEAQAFAVPARCFVDYPHSFLAGLVRFEESSTAASSIFHYACTAVSRDAFATVYRALNRQVLTEDELCTYAKALDFFGVDIAKILVEQTTAVIADPVLAPLVPASSSSSSSSEGATVYTSPQGSVILCDTPERTKHLLQLAIERGEPWVPFRVLFGEGDVWEDPEYSDVRRIEMQPLLATAGSRDNVLFFRFACHAQFCQMPNHQGEPFPQRCEMLRGAVLEPDAEVEVTRRDDNDNDEDRDAREALPTISFGLRAVLKPTAEEPDPVYVTIFHEYDYGIPNAIVLPGGNELAARPRCSPCFHVDATGGVVFNADEAERAQRVFYETRVCDEALRAVREGLLGWRLPQQRRSMSATFCNEALYGRVNLVEVTGLFKVPAVDAVV